MLNAETELKNVDQNSIEKLLRTELNSAHSTQYTALHRVAITGAGGFLGLRLARTLIERGVDPLLLVHSPAEHDWAANARQATLDLTERQAVDEVLAREKLRTIFHLAGTRGLGVGALTWSHCVELNVASTVHLLESAQRHGVKRIIIIGTADEYGNQPGPLSETMALAPGSPYAVSKAVATELAQAMHKRDGCPVVILRPFTVYGPGQPMNMFVSEAVDCAVRGLPFRMTEGRQKRDLVYVDDAIDAFIAAAMAPGVEGQVINIGSGNAHALRDIAQLIWRLSGTDAALMIGARPAGATELHDTWADIERAKEMLSWSPQVSLEAGLSQMIAWVRAQIESMEKECLAK